jgi:hypothetical protein
VPARIEELAGVTVTCATGTTGAAVTVMFAEPLTPFAVAVMVTGPPGASPLTTPAVETLAIAGLLEVQDTACPLTTDPLASSGVAVSCAELPAWIDSEAGLTLTDATV